MNRALAIDIVVLLLVVLVIHVMATTLRLYGYVSFLDKVPHFISGVVIGLSFFGFRKYLPWQGSKVLLVVLLTLLVSLAWEFFEYMAHIAIMVRGYWPDTIADVAVNVLGAVIGYKTAVYKYENKA